LSLANLFIVTSLATFVGVGSGGGSHLCQELAISVRKIEPLHLRDKVKTAGYSISLLKLGISNFKSGTVFACLGRLRT
jgi:hypothetical protein